MKDWTPLTIDNFEEYLSSDSGPNLATPSTAPTATTTPVDVTVITNAVSTAMLTNPPSSRTEIFKGIDRIPSTTPGAEPPRDARDSGSARSHSTHLETSSSNRP